MGAPGFGGLRTGRWTPLATLAGSGPNAAASSSMDESPCSVPHKARKTDLEAHMQVIPSKTLMGWVSRAILLKHEDGMQPGWRAAERFMKGSRAGAHAFSSGHISPFSLAGASNPWRMSVWCGTGYPLVVLELGHHSHCAPQQPMGLLTVTSGAPACRAQARKSRLFQSTPSPCCIVW